MKLTAPQIAALRYANSRQLWASTINDGNGNMRRSIQSLFKIGLIDWHPTFQNVVLTKAGQAVLDQTPRNPIVYDYLRAKRRCEETRSPQRRVKWSQEVLRIWKLMPAHARKEADRIWLAAGWNGLCEAGKHGLDFKGQRCDLCQLEATP